MDAADNFGNLFKNLGIATDASATMSKQLVTTASDLASFFNADPSQMLEAVSSALAGEYDPLQRYGMAINAAAVQQEALSSGLAKTKNEITPAIQAQAAYALILKNTGAAQGDFARTADGAANQQRIFAAGMTNLKATLGTELLPVLNAGLHAMNGLLGVFQAMPSGVSATVVGLGAAVVGISAAGIAVGKVRSGLAEFGIATDAVSLKMKTVEGTSTRLGSALGAVGKGLGIAALAVGAAVAFDALIHSGDAAAASINKTTAALLDVRDKGAGSMDALFSSLSNHNEDDIDGFTDALKRPTSTTSPRN